ncbi:hypothetical protein [Brachybacterium muris]|uniref:ABC transporter permease n=1 Tax=Brachybacterium muris UCD-AY4 TaxID=1249481 RepID=A0A022KZQ6_9MICO|nr:hypothetical protein [Brachybacterium muris]EYT48753.1 ABC transporter permease [Brachybacterium muris UCD-AY4]
MFVGPLPLLGRRTSEIFVAAAVVVALLRRPRFALGGSALLVPLFAVMLLYLGTISLFAVPEDGAADWRLRLLRIAAVTVLIFVTASGRLDLRSGVIGIAAVCVINIPLFYAGLVSDTYGGYLTGVFGDKNYAGLTYAMVAVLATAVVERRWTKVAVFLAFAGPLWLTGSRTSSAAYLLAGLWMLLAPYLGLAARIVLGVLSYIAVEVTAEDYSRVGVFSDRLGSDLLRARIDAASRIKVEETDFFGRGLGTAFVRIEDRSWFFHNSYWSALVEGGWPWAVFLVAVTVAVLLLPHRDPRLAPLRVSAGLGIVALVTATRLGEVFYTLPWALAIAFGIQALARAHHDPGEREPRERARHLGRYRPTASQRP